MKQIEFKTFVNVAKFQYGNVVNAINAYNNGNKKMAKSILVNVIQNLNALHFYDFILFSDFQNNEMDFETYDISKNHAKNDVIFIDDNFFVSENIKSILNDDDYYNDKSHFTNGANSVIYLMFGYNLGQMLIKNWC